METLTITRPDDWHLHLRDGAQLRDIVAFTAQQFGRALVMPNLRPPVTTVAMAAAYRERILAALPAGSNFEPWMTLYLTDNTTPDEIRAAKQGGIVLAAKLYPAGATTNSDAGVTDVARLDAVFEAMAECGLVLCVHGEVTADAVDIFEREHRFIETVLAPTAERHPSLKIVFEHITTRAAVEFVLSQSDRVGATITPQHLLYNRNALFQGGIRPHYYCLPVLKTERDREVLLDAATSGDPKFFLGTDSAPHARHAKETTCGCAGIFSAPLAMELYAEAFESRDALDRLEGFASHFGADFYELPRNQTTVTLKRSAWTIPEIYPFGDADIVPFRAGTGLAWKLG